MRFAIVESGGKQYRVIEGRAIEVDRLPVEAGNKFDIDRILLMADGEDIMVGTPTVSDILVKVTVVDHVKGPKIDRFRYRPKKRIRVRGGHRQHYTRLMVDFIGRPDEERRNGQAEAAPADEAPKAEKAPRKARQAKAETEAEAPKSTKKAPAKAESTKKSSTTKSSPRKTEKK